MEYPDENEIPKCVVKSTTKKTTTKKTTTKKKDTNVIDTIEEVKPQVIKKTRNKKLNKNVEDIVEMNVNKNIEENFDEINNNIFDNSLTNYINEIKSKKDLKMTDEYFIIFDYYSKIYGENSTVIFLQNGTFYELYGIDNEIEKCFAQIKIVCDILNVVLSRKDKKILYNNRENVLMAGVPVHSAKKHIEKLLQNGYTIIIYNQSEKPNGSFERKLEEIISPSIQLDYDIEMNNITTNKDNNYFVSIYLYCGVHYISKKEIWTASISCMDVSTGKICLYELTNFNSQNKTLDDRKENLFMDIKRILNVCPCYEIILTIEISKEIFEIHSKEITTRFACTDAKSVSQPIGVIINEYTTEYIDYYKSILEIENKKCYIYFNIKDDTLNENHRIHNIFANSKNNWFIKSYQETFFNQIFTKRKKLIGLLEEFNLENEYTRNSLIILCQFIHNHNPILLKDLDNPKWFDNDNNEYDYLKFENNTLDQLNIFPNQTNIHKTLRNQYSNITSLFDVIDHTCSVLGYRYLKECLNKPFSKKNINEIQNINKHIEICIDNDLNDKLRNKFMNLFDIERYYRKIQLQKIQIYELYNFYDTICKCIDIGNIWNVYFENLYMIDVMNMNLFKEWFDNIYEVDNLQYLTNFKPNSIKHIQNLSIFNKGICKEIDDITTEINILKNNLEDEKNIFDKKYSCESKIDNSDKDGFYLTITLSKFNKINTTRTNYKFKTQSSIVKITNKNIEDITNKLDELHSKLNQYNKKYWNIYLTELLTKINEEWIIHIGYMDFILNGAYIAIRNNYVCPIIDNQSNSYINVKSLRHPLIEKILPNHQKYIANDISIGNNDETGYVIFGTNSCGKSVLMKSVGIAIILAQIGYYVPCSQMIYSPFNNILTRITGRDDLLKGHSSFTIEMLELNLILEKSNINSLVIGDEICHGTETTSGIAIMSSTLIHLAKNKIPFILTSHLHHLSKVDEVLLYQNIKFKHLSVRRDIVNNRLIFERKLNDGSGLANYGIEVAKFIIHSSNKEFIELSEKIRYKLLNDNCQGNLLSIKKSNYNKSKLLNMCEICNNYPANQTHHIIEQQHKNKNGFVFSNRDNRKIYIHDKSNLVGLCENCHLEVHGKNKLSNRKLIIHGYELTTDGEILNFEYN